MSSPDPQAEALVDAALRHVPFEGMNARALASGAREVGIDAALVDLLVPRGGAGLAAAYHRRGDAALRDSLRAAPPVGRFRDRVAEAVMRRLALADRELVRAGAATLALPANAPLGLRLTAETADVIWTALGDSAQDVNWWTKRATLAAVIGATVLYWLDDRSPNAADTRAFLDRRIEGIMAMEEWKAKARRIPGAERLARAATGWIHAPRGGAL